MVEKELKVKKKLDKISKKHLTQMQNLINTINAIQYNIGKMEMQKQTALDEMKKYQKQISGMQDLLVTEYGTFDVNVADGTINWPKSEPNGVEKENKNEK